LGVHGTFQWELVGRGVSEARRGQALSLAFGVGPFLALAAAFGAQAALEQIAFPWNFAALYGATVPLMLLAGWLSLCYVLPEAADEPPREPLLPAVFGGLTDYLGDRNIRLAAICLILVSAGYNVLGNMTLFTEAALGTDDQYTGYQMALRFGCKAIVGLALGLLLTRTHPKVGVLVTGGFCLAAVLWVLWVPGVWFMAAFGLIGIGELFGVYCPNYILSCSPKARMRRNMAFTSMLNMPAGFSPVLYGAIAESVRTATGNERLGFQASFGASAAMLVAMLLLAAVALPARPRPPE
jgi:hypothetical protein